MPASRRAHRSSRPRLRSGSATTTSSPAATSSSRGRPPACSSSRAPAAASSSSGRRTRSPRQGSRCLLGGQGGRAASCPLPGRGAGRPRHPCQHRQSGRRSRRLSHLGLVLARGTRPRLRDRSRRARDVLPRANDAEAERAPRRHRRRDPVLRLPAPLGKSTGNILNVDGGVALAYPR